MRKPWLLTFLILAVFLASCSQASSPATLETVIPDGPPMACQISSSLPPATDPASINLPAVNANDWARGAENAAMTVLIYSDFQCPACSQAAPAVQQFEEANPGQVRVVYRHFPLPQHDKAMLAAQAAEAAGLQDKFWEMHDFLFDAEQWNTWPALSVADFETWLVQQASSLGLNAAQFKTDLVSDSVIANVNADLADGTKIGIFQTPTLFVFLGDELIYTHNDQVPYDPSVLKMILDISNLRPKQFNACPPVIIDAAKTYTATLKTEIGDIQIKLFADKAPLAVNNFVFLSKMGFYDGVTFHRVLANMVAQAGDPSGSGVGGPGYQFANEISADLTFDRAGLVGMANAGVDTNGSQFFITYTNLSQLDGDYTIFGEVVEGMDVVNKLTLRDPADPSIELPQGTLINTILIEEQ